MERIATIAPKDGLYVCPTSQFAETANSSDADIQPDRAGEDDLVPVTSMLVAIGLGVGRGEEIRFAADGDDAEATLDALEVVLSTPEVGDEE